jgi:hypothetical protein
VGDSFQCNVQEGIKRVWDLKKIVYNADDSLKAVKIQILQRRISTN